MGSSGCAMQYLSMESSTSTICTFSNGFFACAYHPAADRNPATHASAPARSIFPASVIAAFRFWVQVAHDCRPWPIIVTPSAWTTAPQCSRYPEEPTLRPFGQTAMSLWRPLGSLYARANYFWPLDLIDAMLGVRTPSITWTIPFASPTSEKMSLALIPFSSLIVNCSPSNTAVDLQPVMLLKWIARLLCEASFNPSILILPALMWHPRIWTSWALCSGSCKLCSISGGMPANASSVGARSVIGPLPRNLLERSAAFKSARSLVSLSDCST